MQIITFRGVQIFFWVQMFLRRWNILDQDLLKFCLNEALFRPQTDQPIQALIIGRSDTDPILGFLCFADLINRQYWLIGLTLIPMFNGRRRGLCFSCAADNSTKLTFPCYFITSILNIYIGQFLGQGYQKIEYIFFRLVFTVKYIGIGMYVRRIFWNVLI